MKKLTWLAISLLLLAGCSGIRVIRTQSADNTDFSHYRSFAFLKTRARGDTIAALFEERTALIKTAIREQLLARGLIEDPQHPDLVINIGIVIREQLQPQPARYITEAPRYLGERDYSWRIEPPEMEHYREGTMAIHLVDAAAKKQVWNGVVRSVVPENNSGLQKAARDAIKKLFRKFPVPLSARKASR